MRFLLIEDDRTLVGFIRKAMKEDGHICEVAHDGEEGLKLAAAEDYDLIILDLMLPKRDGMEVLQALRKRRIHTPILILSARGLVDDKVRGLNAGADDYLSKPFSIDELRARIGALLRRTSTPKSNFLQAGDLKLDLYSRKAFRGGREIQLTAREFSLLEFFMRNVGRVLPRTSIAEHVWDYSFDWGSNVVDVFVNHLRNKIETDPKVRLIHTVRGVGYRFGPEKTS